MIRKTQPDARMVMTKAAGERSTHAAKDIAVLHSEEMQMHTLRHEDRKAVLL